MRKVTFHPLPGIGREGLTPSVTASLDQFVLRLPYLLYDTMVPLRVLNSILASGRLDAGMSGGAAWEPFQIDEREYEELVAALQQQGRPSDFPGRYRVLDPPSWVQNDEDWFYFLQQYDYGFPASDHRRLNEQCEAAQEAAWATQKKGDPEETRRAWEAYEEAGRRFAAAREADRPGFITMGQRHALIDRVRNARGELKVAEAENDATAVKRWSDEIDAAVLEFDILILGPRPPSALE